jgi:polysaccharide biosynthesis protein PslA
MRSVREIGEWGPAATIGQRQTWALSGLAFSFVSSGLIALAILLVSVASGALYHAFAYGDPLGLLSYAGIGLLVAFLYVLPFAFRDEFKLESYIARPQNIARLLLIWTYAFAALGVVAFLTKTTADYSRAWLVLFYGFGFAAILSVDYLIRRGATAALMAGRLSRRRLMLIGTADQIRQFVEAEAGTRSAHHVTTTVELPSGPLTGSVASRNAMVDGLLDRALTVARAQDIESVVLLTDWSEMAFVERCVNAFAVLPVAIHLDAGRLARRFNGIRLESVGAVTALALTEPPLAPFQGLLKRLLDVTVASVALVALAPVFAIIGLMIKLDSKGPVFFKQRRRGYNQREFRIYKFRSMTTMDDGDTVVQARKDDVRITRLGGFLRRMNLDELPQLLNVLKGEMSIVGPRPHAVAHDQFFEQRIGKYPRRLNVRPGITGWAQVNGLRGETDTDAKMEARVEHDLYYIDHWSLGLDISILVRTVLSRTSYQNAR